MKKIFLKHQYTAVINVNQAAITFLLFAVLLISVRNVQILLTVANKRFNKYVSFGIIIDMLVNRIYYRLL